MVLRDLRTLQLLPSGWGFPTAACSSQFGAHGPQRSPCPRPLPWTPPSTLPLALRASCARRIPRPKLRAELAPESRPLGGWKNGLSASDAEKLPATPAGRPDALGGAKPRGLGISHAGAGSPAAPRPPPSPSFPGPREGEAPATGRSGCLVIASGSNARPFLGSGAKQPGALSPRCRETPALLLNFRGEHPPGWGLAARARPLASSSPPRSWSPPAPARRARKAPAAPPTPRGFLLPP